MNKKVEMFLEELEEKIRAYGLSHQEIADNYKIVEIFAEAELITESEWKLWKQKLSESVSIALGKLYLSNRANNALSRAGIKTIHELKKYILSGELLGIRNVGKTTLEEIMWNAIQSGIIQIEDIPMIPNNINWNRTTESVKMRLLNKDCRKKNCM